MHEYSKLTSSPRIHVMAESMLLSLSATLGLGELPECPFTREASLRRIYSIRFFFLAIVKTN